MYTLHTSFYNIFLRYHHCHILLHNSTTSFHFFYLQRSILQEVINVNTNLCLLFMHTVLKLYILEHQSIVLKRLTATQIQYKAKDGCHLLLYLVYGQKFPWTNVPELFLHETKVCGGTFVRGNFCLEFALFLLVSPFVLSPSPPSSPTSLSVHPLSPVTIPTLQSTTRNMTSVPRNHTNVQST